MAIDDTKLAELTAKHGEVFELPVPKGSGAVVYATRISRLNWRRYKNIRETNKDTADEQVCQWCVVYPDLPGIEALFDKYPVYSGIVANRILELSGLDTDDVKKE